MRPPVRCPDCGDVELVVDWTRRAAQCGNCGAEWTPQTIGLLARRIESDGDQTATG